MLGNDVRGLAAMPRLLTPPRRCTENERRTEKFKRLPQARTPVRVVTHRGSPRMPFDTSVSLNPPCRKLLESFSYELVARLRHHLAWTQFRRTSQKTRLENAKIYRR